MESFRISGIFISMCSGRLSATRKIFPIALILPLVFLFLSSCLERQEAPPNILFIVADDMGAWALSAESDLNAHTPHLDRLATNGLVFSQFFSNSANCSPSRACLITGRYPSETGITDVLGRAEVEGLPLDMTTFPEAFSSEGYRTAFIGKWHLGEQEKEYWPDHRGYDKFVGFSQKGAQSMSPTIMVDGNWQTFEEAYTSDLLSDFAISYIGEMHPSKTGDPFLLSLHFWAPHANTGFPEGMEPQHEGRSWLPLKKEDMLPWDTLNVRFPEPDFPNLDTLTLDRMIREYHASVHSVDRNVGRVLNYLETEGLLENTIVIFTSDHGYMSGHNGLWHKGRGWWMTFNQDDPAGVYGNKRINVFDHSLRTPCIVHWPRGLPSPDRINNPLSFVDWFPTLLDMAGIEARPEWQLRGKSFYPLMQEKNVDINTDVYAEFTHLRSIRTEEWKLVLDFSANALHEFYHIARDPEEKRNLFASDQQEHQEIKKELSKRIIEKMELLDDPLLAQWKAGKTSDSEKPNIIIILADDLGYGDIGGYYGGKAVTTNLNTLAHEGMLFTDFHSNGPMCSPTRAALLTGRYQNRMGIETALPGQWEQTGKGAIRGISSPENIKEKSMADYLRKAGYATGFFGKWHLGNHPDANPVRYGFDEFKGLTSGCGDYFSKLDRFGYRDWWHNEKLAFQEGYTTDVITENGIEFIKKNKEKPFFVYLAHLGVHFPWQGPDDAAMELRREGEEFTSNFPGPSSKLGPHTPEKVPDVLTEMIESLDANVGRLMEFLKAEGLDKNTIVFFTADNGQYLNYQDKVWPNIGSNGILRGEKSDLYEGGHRVPAIAWWPGKIAPLSVSHHTFMTFDLLPTFLDVLDISAPPESDPNRLDGTSMFPVWLNSQKEISQRTLFWRTPRYKAVRKGPWKLLQTREGYDSEIYHLGQDISESNNLVKEHPEMLEILTSELTAWEREMQYK